MWWCRLLLRRLFEHHTWKHPRFFEAVACRLERRDVELVKGRAGPGQWQSDHGDAESVLKLCSRGEAIILHHAAVTCRVLRLKAQSLLIVPQASLVCKLELGDRRLGIFRSCELCLCSEPLSRAGISSIISSARGTPRPHCQELS